MNRLRTYKFPKKQWFPRIGYGYGYEDVDEGNSSYDYHEGVLGFSALLFWKIYSDASFTYTRTFYEDDPTFGKRDDTNLGVSVSLSRSFLDRFQLQAVYNYTYNDSNDSFKDKDRFEFKKNVYMLSLTWVF